MISSSFIFVRKAFHDLLLLIRGLLRVNALYFSLSLEEASLNYTLIISKLPLTHFATNTLTYIATLTIRIVCIFNHWISPVMQEVSGWLINSSWRSTFHLLTYLSLSFCSLKTSRIVVIILELTQICHIIFWNVFEIANIFFSQQHAFHFFLLSLSYCHPFVLILLLLLRVFLKRTVSLATEIKSLIYMSLRSGRDGGWGERQCRPWDAQLLRNPASKMSFHRRLAVTVCVQWSSYMMWRHEVS
jgi:hypothetical protein